MKPQYLASYITFSIVFVVAFAVYLQKYNPEIYQSILIFVLSWALFGFLWMLIYAGIDRHRNKNK